MISWILNKNVHVMMITQDTQKWTLNLVSFYCIEFIENIFIFLKSRERNVKLACVCVLSEC